MALGVEEAAVDNVREHVSALTRAVETLQSLYGDTLGIRRLVSDVHRLTDDLDELGPRQPGHVAPGTVTLEPIPDEPYDDALWADAEHEGLGAPGRRAP